MAAIIQRLRNFIYAVLDAPSQVSIEFILGCFAVFWGIWVLYPYTDSFSSLDYYGTALSVMPEYAWGLLAIICGLGQIVFLTRRCKTATVIHRKAFLLIQFMLWVTLAMNFILSIPSTAIPVYVTMAALAGYSMIRVGDCEQ